MAKAHKTMRGKVLNMDQVAIRNEKAIALGNMNVNAAGDTISSGSVVKTRSQRIKEENALHSMVPTKMPVVNTKSDLAKEAPTLSAAEKILMDSEIPLVVSATTPPPSDLSSEDIDGIIKE